MHVGKTLFAQVMEFLPWSTFDRIVERYQGDRRVRRLPCGEQFRCMAFAQLTYRDSLRDIEACLAAQGHKLYHMGFRQAVSRSTLADANESRDWRIYAEFAQRLITQARKLYAADSFGLDLNETVYALDATTIDLCLSVFPWGWFRSTKAAVKLHTLLDLRGSIPTFIHIPDGKLHDVNVLDILVPEPGAFYVMDRAYVDFARLHALSRAGSFFVTRAKKNMNARRLYSEPADRASGVICDQTIVLNVFRSHQGYPEQLRRIRYTGAQSGKRLIFLTNQFQLPAADHLRAVQVPLAGRVVLQVDQATPADQAIRRHFRECRTNSDLDRRGRVRPDRDHQETPQPHGLSSHAPTDSVGIHLRESSTPRGTYRFRSIGKSQRTPQPVATVRLLAGQQ